MFSKSMYLPRPKLTEEVFRTVNSYRLTVIVAPMGYGKTTLASSVTERAGKTAYGYPIPTGPHDARFLWHDMSTRFESQGMAVAESMRRLGLPETASQTRKAVDLLRGLSSPAYLVLDDYHHVTDPAMSAFWEGIVRAEIPDFHLVLFSRTRPDMHLEELRIKRLAAVFEQEILAFSEAEAGEYFRMHAVRDAKAASDAWRYSEGWPAALWLCLQSWLACGMIAPSPDIESLLANTVFSSYDAREQDLLMRLSVMDLFTEQDAGRLSAAPSSTARLRTLREKNAFLSFEAKTGRYHFHGIFRDFLLKELAAASHIDKPSLYRLAGECCEERRELVAAFRLFAQAGRDEDFQRLLDIFLRLEEERESTYFAEELFGVILNLPWRIRCRNPLGYLAFIAFFSVMWNDHRTATLLEEAEERFASAKEIPAYLKKRIRGELEAIRAMLAFNDMEKVWSHYTEACRLLEGPSVIFCQDSLGCFGSPTLVFHGLREAGTFQRQMDLVDQHIHAYFTLSGGIGKGGEKIMRAEYFLELGDFTRAEPLLRDILPVFDGAGRNMGTTLVGAFCLARLHAATRGAEEALRVLEEVRPHVECHPVLEHYECLDMAAGYINAVLGRYDAIPQWLREGDVFDPPHCSMPQVFGVSLTVHGKALLLAGDYRRLMAVAGEMPARTAAVKSLFVRIHANIFAAIAAWHTRGRESAVEYLRGALELSRPDGIVLPLAEYGGHIVPVLRQLKKLAPEDGHLEKIYSLAGRIAHVAARAAEKNRVRDLLTPREREFMQYAAQGMSNPAIARELGLAEVTVRKALGRAYAKLGATGRFEAARRFIELYGDTRRPIV